MRIIATFSADNKNRCFPPEAWARLEALGKKAGEFHYVPWKRPDPVQGFIDTCNKLTAGAGADILVTGWGAPKITPEVLDANPNLKLIAHSAGSVAFVDIAAWKRPNLKVTNVMTLMGLPVAEFSVLLMLDGLRRMAAHYKPELRNSSPFYTFEHGGFSLRNKRVGLVGFGIIGRQTVDLLKVFGCEIVCYDPFVPADKMAAYANAGVKKIELDELMQTSDVVSIHAPGTPATKNILDERRLRMLKPGAILVNTARGIIIDHDALARVAAEGKIGVFLDVTWPEPLPEDHPLHKLPNVTLTGHCAGPTPDLRILNGPAALDEVERFLNGQPLQNIVTESQYANQSTS